MTETKKAIAAKYMTRIVGGPMKQDVEQLEEELAMIAVKFLIGQFEGGEQFGPMCFVVSQAKYRMTIDNPAWTYTEQDKLEAFDTTLTAMAGVLLQKHQS